MKYSLRSKSHIIGYIKIVSEYKFTNLLIYIHQVMIILLILMKLLTSNKNYIFSGL